MGNHKYTPTPAGTKECRRCHEVKPLSEFNKDKNAPGGKDRWCKDCKRAYYGFTKREKPPFPLEAPPGYRVCWTCGQTYPETREFFVWSNKQGVGRRCRPCANRVNKETRDPEKARLYEQRRDKERNKQRAAEYRAKYPEKVRESMRRSQQKHPETFRLGTQRRRARKRQLPDTFTREDWAQCLEWWNGCCAYCGTQQGFWTKITADHFIPLSADCSPGTVRENMIPACLSCNSSKHTRDATEWTVKKFGQRQAKRILERIQSYFDSLS